MQEPCWACRCAARPHSWLQPISRKRVALPSRVIALSPAFTAFLAEDGMILPSPPPGSELTAADPRFVPRRHRTTASATDSSDAPCFPEVETEIRSSVDELGGEVFIKLESVAPVDAAWIALNGSLKVANAGQAFALLKASERVGHFLDTVAAPAARPPRRHAGSAPETVAAGASPAPGAVGGSGEAPAGAAASTPSPPLHLVLRTWYELHPQREYRAFIRNGRVIAVCSRYPSEAAAAAAAAPDAREPCITADDAAASSSESAAAVAIAAGSGAVDSLRSSLLAFLESSVIPIVPLPLRSLAADVYLDKKGRGWLVDIAPLWTGGVDLIAFAPDELGLPPATDADAAESRGSDAAAAAGAAASAAERHADDEAAGSAASKCPTCSIAAGPSGAAAAASAAGASDASAHESSTSSVLWRIGADAADAVRRIAGRSSVAAGMGPEPAASSSSAADDSAAAQATPHISLPKMAANRFPDELLLLAGSTGRSIADIIGDLEGAVRAAGLADEAAGGGGRPRESLFRRGNGSDSDSDSSDESDDDE